MDHATPEALPLSAWHARFCQQAAWTRALRRYLWERAGVDQARRVLEVGCGTGAILPDLTGEATAAHGLDLSRPHLKFARQHVGAARLVCGDGLALPYAPGSFDATCCHFLLLWIPAPAQALAEMVRVTRPGGAVLVLAEPDYGGRIDYPPELAVLGRWQRQALQRQGAAVEMGRQLGALLTQAGLAGVETGVLGGQWGAAPAPAAQALEWSVLLADLTDSADRQQAERLRQRESEAWQRGERILFVPTFYGWGRVPG